MGNYKDLTGKVFGALTILGLDEKRSQKTGRGYWFCRCDVCNKISSKRSDNFIRKKWEHCGCLNKNIAKDETGKTYGYLTVLHQAKEKSKSGQVKWVCQCKCGNITTVLGTTLRFGATTSCGCKGREPERCGFIDRTGQRFGWLTVLSRDFEHQKGKNVKWNCKCDCGNIISVAGYHLVTGHTISCGCIKSKGEKYISELLRFFKITYVSQYSFPSFRFETGGVPKYDFAIFNSDGEIVFIIEYHGEHHYKEIPFFKRPLSQVQFYDFIKSKYCRDNHIPLEIIPYTEFNNLEAIICGLLKEYNLYKEE